MLCEKCFLNNATVFQIGNDNRDVYICSECFQKQVHNLKNKNFSTKNDNKVCFCGTKLQEIFESGYVGCAKCYDTFNSELYPNIKLQHFEKIQHIGKIPLSKIEKLKMQIEEATKNHFYELASKLKNELFKLEGK